MRPAEMECAMPQAATDSARTARTSVLDDALRLLSHQRYCEAFRVLGGALTAELSAAEAGQRRAELVAHARAHPVFDLCQQDPFTQRAYRKPRGYAGDAVMLDYVYSGTPPAEATLVGREVFRWTTRCPTGLSIRFRRDLLRSFIDDVAARASGFRILSVASGHCREVEGSALEAEVGRGELIAVDQDESSCSLAERKYGRLGVKPLRCSVRQLLASDASLGDFDLIYSAGLFDYLQDDLAGALLGRLKGLLRRDGRLVVGNFIPGYFGRGYMELMMDWRLITRSPARLAELFDGAAHRVRTFVDPLDSVGYAVYR